MTGLWVLLFLTGFGIAYYLLLVNANWDRSPDGFEFYPYQKRNQRERRALRTRQGPETRPTARTVTLCGCNDCHAARARGRS